MQEAQESLSSLLGASREPSLREQIEEMNSSGGCCSLTYEVPESTHASRRTCRHRATPSGRRNALVSFPAPCPDRRAAASSQERIIGFAGCVISGLFLNMLSMIRLTELKCKYFVVILVSIPSLFAPHG